MGTLLSRMTNSEAPEVTLNSGQVDAIVEVLIPKMISEMPGMKSAGLKCSITRDEAGWNIRIDRP